MGKWIGGIAATVAAGVLTWWLTVGIHDHQPLPPKAETYSVTGFWKYKMMSEISSNTYRGSLTLTQDGTTVSGVLDNTFDGSKSGIKGTLIGQTLELSRDTGLGAIQNYRLTKQSDNRLVGRFDNVGPSNLADQGTFEIER
jgi:hypothetical protein